MSTPAVNDLEGQNKKSTGDFARIELISVSYIDGELKITIKISGRLFSYVAHDTEYQKVQP